MKIDRRSFIKAAAAAGLLAVATPKVTFAGLAPDGSSDRLGMMTDFTRCVGCRRCEAACNTANNLPSPTEPFDDMSVFETERMPGPGAYTVVNRYRDPGTGAPVYRKVQCNHCLEPACVSACPVGAMVKSREGPVIYNEDVCIGCRYCIMSCPFYIPAYEYSEPFTPRVQKCFMCYSRVTKGVVPACAEACPMEAITFGERDQLIKLARQRITESPDKYVDHIYGEREAGGTGWIYISGVAFEYLGFPGRVQTTAYPELTRGFLSAVPLVLVLWPGLLAGFHAMSNSRDETIGTKADIPNGKEAQR